MEKSDNELIAEFMGCQRSDYEWDDGEHAYTMTWPMQFYNKMVIPSRMLFHESWDWLMPVVEKIANEYHRGEHWNTEEDLSYQAVTRIPIHHPIEFVYARVITFIKWHNSNKV